MQQKQIWGSALHLPCSLFVLLLKHILGFLMILFICKLICSLAVHMKPDEFLAARLIIDQIFEGKILQYRTEGLF